MMAGVAAGTRSRAKKKSPTKATNKAPSRGSGGSAEKKKKKSSSKTPTEQPSNHSDSKGGTIVSGNSEPSVVSPAKPSLGDSKWTVIIPSNGMPGQVFISDELSIAFMASLDCGCDLRRFSSLEDAHGFLASHQSPSIVSVPSEGASSNEATIGSNPSSQKAARKKRSGGKTNNKPSKKAKNAIVDSAAGYFAVVAVGDGSAARLFTSESEAASFISSCTKACSMKVYDSLTQAVKAMKAINESNEMSFDDKSVDESESSDDAGAKKSVDDDDDDETETETESRDIDEIIEWAKRTRVEPEQLQKIIDDHRWRDKSTMMM